MHQNLQKLNKLSQRIGIRPYGLIALCAIILTLPFSIFYNTNGGLGLAILPLLFVLMMNSRILLCMVLGACAFEFIPLSGPKIGIFVAVIGLVIGAAVGFLIDVASSIRRRLEKRRKSQSSTEYRNANAAPSG